MKLKSLFTRINGKVLVQNVGDDNNNISFSRNLKLAELEDSVQYFKEQLRLAGLSYRFLINKTIH